MVFSIHAVAQHSGIAQQLHSNARNFGRTSSEECCLLKPTLPSCRACTQILDVIDCTGSGDVDTSTTVTADDSGSIQGASGRKLALNPSWQNPSGQWHVGCRRLFELFPKPLQVRLTGL